MLQCGRKTPLSIACSNGAVDVVELFLNDERIDPLLADGNDETPFYLACENDNIDVIELMLLRCDGIVIPDEIFSDKVETILEKYR